MALTGQDILNSITKAPLAQKVAGLGLVIALITVGNWYMLVQPIQQQVAQQQGVLRQLEDDLIQKQSIANNLAQFKHEKEVLERRLQQALTELPNEANIDELIKSLAEVANKSGLTINDIQPQPEQAQSFYAAIPIVMAVTGNYHEIAVFLDALSKLARIVNVTNIKMSNAKQSGDKLVVSASYVATTFRFIPEPPKQHAVSAK
ncbi:MAG TPA: type 4a pilus biogenesis protein PilO [Myxococcales bacterium]|nr:type 4a pilus biogenesis protein PilO [Myxococcales bacterium]